MSADELLSRLAGVRKTGAGRYIACCPSHDDATPSLSITEKSDGLVLIHCFSGCGAVEVIEAVGLEMTALFPEVLPAWESGGKPPVRRQSTFNPASVLQIVAAEVLDVAIIASDIAQGVVLTDDMRERLWDAAGRIASGLEVTHATR